LFVILDLFLLTGIREYGFPTYFQSLIYVGMFLYGLIEYSNTIRTTVVNCFMAAVIVTLLQLVICLPVYYLIITQYGQQEFNELIINTVCLITIIFINGKNRLQKISAFFIKRDKLITIISVLTLVGINLYSVKKNGKFLGKEYIQIIYFLLLFAYIIYEWQKSRLDVEKKKMQLEINALYYDTYEQLIKVIRERQHDIKSHINTIYSMIYTTNNYDELIDKQKEYCGYVLKQNEKTKLLLSVENPLIAGFLYSKIQETDKKGIVFEYDVKLPKNNTFILEYELIEMTGILLDNAVEELENLKCNEKRIKLILIEQKDGVFFKVANTSVVYEDDTINQFFEKDYSSKSSNRGIGLTKLKNWVNEKNGNIVVCNESYDGKNYLSFEIHIIK
ncbi:MAG: GHKL domain-containing protein, partial [Lachnospiraceae bacterium]|nr:GHKL domain-containing protein [Lachnospiraceae bacterium]